MQVEPGFCTVICIQKDGGSGSAALQSTGASFIRDR
jgi:hypothetical protein